ncbi:MAG: helix-turn-helix transcriptional regulator [Desulfobulbaceae bacterium]|nr:helix-turn-helix transcriptional regulator [Desulfobulbaceae bacterium]
MPSNCYDALTPREQEIMVLLAEGMSTSQVADKLFISIVWGNPSHRSFPQIK